MPVYSKSANLRPSYFSTYGGQQLVPYGAPGQQAPAFPNLPGPFGDMARRLAERGKNEKGALRDAANQAGDFANQGQAGYGGMTAEMAKDREALRALASGQNSIAAEQLRQGLGSQQAAQQSMAASASPQNAAMAARTAMNNMNRNAYGMAGNAAMAGIAERNAATQALAQMNLGQRGQDIDVGLGSRGNQMTGLGANKPDQPKQPGAWDKALAAGGMGLAMFSDERLKENVKDGTKAVRRAFAKLSPKTYDYKDDRMGKGEQVGFLAQDLERAGLKSAVIETPIGKAVDVGKLSGANTAAISDLAKRMAKLEKGGK